MELARFHRETIKPIFIAGDDRDYAKLCVSLRLCS